MAITKQVAAYCRISTLEQQKRGLGMSIQVRDVNEFAAAQNLVIARFYLDEAQSGAAENRIQLKKLLRACARGEIETLIIPSLDRLSRDVRIAENLFHQFNELGIPVMIADMPYYNGENRRDVLIRQIREAIAEDNRKEIIERLLKGRQERVRKGRTPGGNAPYGYRRMQKQFVVDPTEATIIRRIFELAAVPLSSAEIAQQLKEGGFVQRNREDWSSRQVRSVLARREMYESGILRYGSVEGTNQKLVLITRKEDPYDENLEVGAVL
jgi:site-specific DNA recombinase